MHVYKHEPNIWLVKCYFVPLPSGGKSTPKTLATNNLIINTTYHGRKERKIVRHVS